MYSIEYLYQGYFNSQNKNRKKKMYLTVKSTIHQAYIPNSTHIRFRTTE